MMAAKELVAGGGAAAVTAGGQDEGAFESHDCPRSSEFGIGSASAISSSSKKKAAGGDLCLLAIYRSYSTISSFTLYYQNTKDGG